MKGGAISVPPPRVVMAEKGTHAMFDAVAGPHVAWHTAHVANGPSRRSTI